LSRKRRQTKRLWDLDTWFGTRRSRVQILSPDQFIPLSYRLTLQLRLALQRAKLVPTCQSSPAVCWWEAQNQDLELLKENFNRTDLTDDLDPEAERRLCKLAEKDAGIAAVFVLGFPLSARPFSTAPRGTTGQQVVSIYCFMEWKLRPAVKGFTVATTLNRPCADAALILRISRIT
jgi:hypothetical protein